MSVNKLSVRCLFFGVITAIAASFLGCTEEGKVSQQNLQLAAVREVFPTADNLVLIKSDQDAIMLEHPDLAFFSVIKGPSGVLGYYIESEVIARSGPFRISVLLDTELVVMRADVLSYRWERGRGVRKNSFTKQFTGKDYSSKIRITDDIDSVTGATLSCKAMAKGVRKSISLLHRNLVNARVEK